MDFALWEVVTLLAGLLFILAGTVWWTVAAFRRGIGWGLGCLFFLIPVGVIFAIRDWHRARGGVGLTAAGLLFLLPGAMVLSKKWTEILDLAHTLQRDLFPGL